MKRSAIYRFLRMIVLTFSTLSLMSFTVVIDAGHGDMMQEQLDWLRE
jgi:hypothetical protein